MPAPPQQPTRLRPQRHHPHPQQRTPEEQQPLDMRAERDASRVNVDALATLLAGSESRRQRQKWLMSLLKRDPAFDKRERPFLGRTERFHAGQRLALAYFALRNRYGLPKEDRDLLRLYLDEYITLQVHESMGAETIARQGDDAQWEAWGPDIRSGRWLLCYAQTELAHGSNLSGLRTTAELDLDTDEWVIHTPEPSAGKAWIGGAGCTATHAIVMAQLIIRGERKGMHPFLVPLRDLETHQLLPGRDAIDMGPKVGAPAMDNGYIVFDRVRVPRSALLGRYVAVSREGKYETRNAHAKPLMRASMTLVRVGLGEIAAHHAARATVVATRYAVVRRQGSSKGTGLVSSAAATPPLEPPIIDWASVQARLVSCMATAYALTLASQHMRDIYNTLQAELKAKGTSPLLAVVHGYTSILKATMTAEGLGVVETARRALGGHGFSAACGLIDVEHGQATAGLTYEGDNNMLLANVGPSFLMSELSKIRSNGGRASRPELAFLEQVASPPSEAGTALGAHRPPLDEAAIERPEVQLELLGRRAARLAGELHALHTSSGPRAPGVDAHLYVALGTRASRAFAAYFTVYAIGERLRHASATTTTTSTLPASSASLDAPTLSALRRLCLVYTVQCVVLPELGDFVEHEPTRLGADDVATLRRAGARAMVELRRDIVGLGDAFEFDDDYLGSALGSHDGRAYERMIAFMRSNPLNREGERDERGVVRGFRDALGKLTHQEVEGWNELEARRREEEQDAERRQRMSRL